MQCSLNSHYIQCACHQGKCAHMCTPCEVSLQHIVEEDPQQFLHSEFCSDPQQFLHFEFQSH